MSTLPGGRLGAMLRSDMPIIEALWFGEPGEEQADLEAARSFAATVAEVQGLRPFSPAVQRLLMAVQNEFYTVVEVTEIIEGDTSLAARVMRSVNSAAYGLRQRCKSIDHAVALLGANAISQMAAAMAILDQFAGNEGPAAGVTQHSVAAAGLARVIGSALKLPDRDALFTCGLLHDIGKLMLLQVSDTVTIGPEADPYPGLLLSLAGKLDMVHQRERELYGYDHAVLAGHVLRAWKIPEPVPQVVAWHHQPLRAYDAPGDLGKLVAAVRVADQLSFRVIESPEPDMALVEALCNEADATRIGLDDRLLTSLWDDLYDAARTG